jgi:hypothetical protein
VYFRYLSIVTGAISFLLLDILKSHKVKREEKAILSPSLGTGERSAKNKKASLKGRLWLLGRNTYRLDGYEETSLAAVVVRIPTAGAEVSIGSTNKDFDLIFILSI